MKRISNSDLLIGLEYPNQEVQLAYLTYALKRWLTSKKYGPQALTDVKALRDLLPAEVKTLADENIKMILPKLIAETKGINFDKIDLVWQNNWGYGKDFSFRVLYAVLSNFENYPHSSSSETKNLYLDRMLNVQLKVENIETWIELFASFSISESVLKAFSIWLEKKPSQTFINFDSLGCLLHHPKPKHVRQIFNISLYLMKNFKVDICCAVKKVDRLCCSYPKLRKKFEAFLLENFDLYFKNLCLNSRKNYFDFCQNMMTHLNKDILSLSRHLKMQMVQKLLGDAKEEQVILYLFDQCKYIYNCQIKNVDEDYLKTLKTVMEKCPENVGDIYACVNNFYKYSSGVEYSQFSWKFFSLYPLAWQRALLEVYSSPNLPEKYRAQAYFALVYMYQVRPQLFARMNFIKLDKKMRALDWDITGRKIFPLFEIFKSTDFSEISAFYIQQGINKLLITANDNQVWELSFLRETLPNYVQALDFTIIQKKLADIDDKNIRERKVQEEKEKEIAFLLAKIR